MVPTLHSAPQQAPSIRSLQLILCALAGGLVTFGTLVAVLRSMGMKVGGSSEVHELLAYIAIALFVPGVCAAFKIRMKATAKIATVRDDSMVLVRQDRVPAALASATITAAALVEGPGLLAIVTLLLGGPIFVIAIALLSAGVILFMLPTRSRLEDMMRY